MDTKERGKKRPNRSKEEERHQRMLDINCDEILRLEVLLESTPGHMADDIKQRLVELREVR